MAVAITSPATAGPMILGRRFWIDWTANAMPWFARVTVAPTVVNVTGTDKGSQPRIKHVATMAAAGESAIRKIA